MYSTSFKIGAKSYSVLIFKDFDYSIIKFSGYFKQTKFNFLILQHNQTSSTQININLVEFTCSLDKVCKIYQGSKKFKLHEIR